MTRRTLHGVVIDVPDSFEDHSLFRFRAPKPPEPPSKIPSSKSTLRIEPNLIVTRHVRDAAVSIERVFDRSNAEYTATNATFSVLQSGTAMYLGQRARWQDSRQVHPQAQVAAHQRHIAIERADDALEYALVVITGDRNDVDAISSAIGFTPT